MIINWTNRYKIKNQNLNSQILKKNEKNQMTQKITSKDYQTPTMTQEQARALTFKTSRKTKMQTRWWSTVSTKTQRSSSLTRATITYKNTQSSTAMKSNLTMRTWWKLKKTRRAGMMPEPSILMKVISLLPTKKTTAWRLPTAKLWRLLSKRYQFATRNSTARIPAASLNSITILFSDWHLSFTQGE